MEHEAKSIRKVAVFTGNRAEYGLQFPVLRAIADHPRLEPYLLVSGAHLKEDFGRTLEEIRRDGFEPYAEIRIEGGADDLIDTARAIGSGILGLTPVLAEIDPDLLVVYADRFESFAALIAGTQMGIPTAHIEGGDLTEGGALDDSVRHAMTKLAHLHFTTNEEAAERVRKLGEEPWRVFNVGFPALDLVAQGNYASPQETRARLGLSGERPLLIFTQHSVATEFDQATDQVGPALAALDAAAEKWGCDVIITYPNDDAGGRRITDELRRYEERRHPRIQVHRSLGRYYYHGVLNIAAACIGNSSSGIKETLAFGCPCVNIGARQQGRLRGENVLDVPYERDLILEAIARCIEDADFRARVRTAQNPYGAGDAGARISEVLCSIDLDARLIQKRMTY